MQEILPGIWKLTLGRPETHTPVRHRLRKPAAKPAFAALPAAGDCPLAAAEIRGGATTRGYELFLPMRDDEQFYGLGLQLLSFDQRGRKKTLRVNSDPCVDLGDSHAPVPFYVSTRGYAVLVDTYRYATFNFGGAVPKHDRSADTAVQPAAAVNTNLETLYSGHAGPAAASVAVEVPAARGVTVYVFAGPAMLESVRRYNLFSGGGCLPPRWGLGVWYRCCGTFDQQQAAAMAADFRRADLPCDVLGLEPGWQTHAYSCSHVWSKKFPAPADLVRTLAAQGYHVNLWTHAFTHAASPLYRSLYEHSGDYEVWKGLTPDFVQPETRRIFGEFYDRTHVALGVSGYKLDECDGSDFIATPWSFPEISRFPSGLDGEQMHSAIGLHFQETIDQLYRRRNLRTYNEVRNSHALAAPYPFVLYSDLYDHRQFLRGVVNQGFSGLLWCPEVRHAASAEELIRRIQAAALSPQALINAWYIKNPPWKQWDRQKNNADELVPNHAEVEAACRDIFRLRMSLVPYLYSAFFRYWSEGLPPFRALVLDYPTDPQAATVDDQWLVGDRLLVAPVVANTGNRRTVYLPAGDWFDFWIGARMEGGRKHEIEVPLGQIPIYVKDGALLPLAEPGLHAADPAGLRLTVRVYGDGCLPLTLIEDDGVTYDFEKGAYNRLDLTWDPAAKTGAATRTGTTSSVPAYTVTTWRPGPMCGRHSCLSSA